MPISISILLGEVASSVSAEHRASLASGALNGDEVWFEYVTMHDSRVRPSHAALDGTTWRMGDPDAPIPPLDYGCRCSMRYVAKPGAAAANVLPEARVVPIFKGAVYARHLDEIAPAWKDIQAEALKLPVGDRLGVIYVQLRQRYPSLKDARDVAMMVLEADNGK